MKTPDHIFFGLILVSIFFIGFWAGEKGIKETEKIVYRIDTIVRWDTVKEVVEKPVCRYIVRYDTTFVYVYDSIEVPVYIPIERKEYRTERYHAVIEGYHPELISLTTYPETKYITRTETHTITKRKRLGIGIQAGYGITKQGFSPYVGIGVQYNLFSF